MENVSVGKVRLERALSKLGLASRSEARGWIREGRIAVDGRVVVNPLTAVIPEKIRVSKDSVELLQPKRRTFIFYKPRGVITSRRDEKSRKTVFDFFSAIPEKLHAVGRLDFASTGLLIVTNDTRFSSFLTDPTNRVKRTYVVTVRGRVGCEDLEKLDAEKIELRKSSGRGSHLLVELTEGRNRQIRKMFAEIGHEVTSLKRIAYGDFELGDLKSGEFREVSVRKFA